MKWLPGKTQSGKVDPYYIGSDCLIYCIAKVKLGDHWEYVSSRLNEKIGQHMTADEAKACCEKDKNGRGR